MDLVYIRAKFQLAVAVVVAIVIPLAFLLS